MPPPYPTFDLQSHSLHSDGALAAAEVVARAAAAGVELLALTDHDTVDGVEEAQAAARRCGIALVPAVEISAVDGEHEDLHLLGYGIDPRDGALAERLIAWREDRAARIDRMAARLEELGWALERRELERRRAAGKPIGRPHLAGAAVLAPANAARLREEGLRDPTAFLVRHLVPGSAAYVPRTFPSVGEAIDAVHAAGGVAVWAHPFWDVDAADAVRAAIGRFAARGLDGVEAFYVTHTRAQTELAWRRCEELGLLSTGSADFHGPDHPRFSRFRAFDLHGLTPRLGPLAGG